MVGNDRVSTDHLNIDWGALVSCRGYSDASNIPAAIDLLFSRLESERKVGYWGIDNHAIVQSDLCSSAPYAARAIVDRLLAEQVVTRELVDILYELYCGTGAEVLSIGPLAGESLDVICKRIVSESESVLARQLDMLEPELASEVTSLINLFREPVD